VTLWRACAERYSAEGEGTWTGRWRRSELRAAAQAARWAERGDCVAVWVEVTDDGGRTVREPAAPARCPLCGRAG
jgi:hypothetical protein